MTFLDKLKAHWKTLLSILGAVVGLLWLRDFFQKDLKAKLNNAEVNKENAVLETKKEELLSDIKKEEDNQKELQEKLENEAPKMTDKEILDFYNKKK